VRKVLLIVMPLVVLGAGVAGFLWLKATRPETAARSAQERVWTVETATVAFTDARPRLTLYGEIAAGREVALRALVPGPVLSVYDGFLDGAAIAAGTVLVKIDPFDAEQTVAERTSALAESQARLAETRARLEAERALAAEDKKQVEIYERDVTRRRTLVGKAVSEKGLDEAELALSQSRAQMIGREQTIAALEATLAQQDAVIAGQRAELARAERAVADTALVAPFDGYLADVAAQPGERLAAGDKVARLIDSGRMEARFHIGDAAFGRIFESAEGAIGRAAEVVWQTGATVRRFDAVIDRIDSEIESATGGVTAYASLVAGEEAGLALLRPGAFVEVVLDDRAYHDVARLPAAAVHEGGTVYVVVDDRLAARAVTVVGRDGEDALVRGDIAPGEAVVLSRLTEIGPGLKVAVR